MAEGRVLIVDKEPGRRAALRADLALPEGEVAVLADPAGLARRIAQVRPDLLLLDIPDADDPALEGLRCLRAGAEEHLPAIALVPPGRPDLRLAALAAGADDATERGTPPRLLQARIRSLRRHRDDALALSPQGGREGAWSGLSEAPAAFSPSARAPALLAGPGCGLPALASGASAASAASGRARVALLSAWPAGAVPPPEAVARLLDAEVDRLRSAAELGGEGAGRYDLVLIDGAGTRGDLVQGARVLALLADLQGRQRGGPASTLVLLPATAIETAALALDLGAGDVIAGPVAPREVELRARALIVRRRLRAALRDQVRLGLRAAVTDPLTGLHNRRYAEAALRRMAEEGAAAGPGTALLMIDIDHFKPINDTHGHAAGDRVLVQVAHRLRQTLRPGDLLARVGGEEFLVALPAATEEEARAVGERLRDAVGRRPFLLDAAGDDDRRPPPGEPMPWDGPAAARSPRLPRVSVTVSVGVAASLLGGIDAESGLAALVRRADAALYAAKSAGRNAVTLSPLAAPTAPPSPAPA